MEPEPEIVPAGEIFMTEDEAIVKYLSEEERQQTEKVSAVQKIYRLNTAEKIITALKGSREERAILIRDPNRIVSTAVLGSPRITEAEIESISGMKSVSDEILRTIGNHREWTKRYTVLNNLVRNPRTPIGIALSMVPRLNPRDIKGIAVDRNVPEPVRKQAQKFVKGEGQQEAVTSAMADYYQLLGVSPQASVAEVRQAYARLAREKHPDRFRDEAAKKRRAAGVPGHHHRLQRARQPEEPPGVRREPGQAGAAHGRGDRHRRLRARAAGARGRTDRGGGDAAADGRAPRPGPARVPARARACARARRRRRHARRSRCSSGSRSLQPQNAAAHAELATVLARQGLKLRAQKAVEAALRLAPRDARLVEARGRAGRGKTVSGVRITCEAVSDVGRKRKGNEDALFLNEEQRLYVVADGMGGHAAGEVASKVAVEAIAEFVALTGGNQEITWPFGLDDSISYEGNRLKTAVRHANSRVLEATRESAEYEGMATTVAAVLVDGDVANLAHVGDSRIYLWSGGAIELLDARPLLGQRADRERRHLARAGAQPPAAQRGDAGARRPRGPGGGHPVAPHGVGGHAAAVLGRPHHHDPRRRHRAHPGRGRGRRVEGRERSRGRGERARRRGQHHRPAAEVRGLKRVLPQAADARTGPRIGKYLITGRIGRGGMGMVYRGLDPALEREVAIKTLVAEGSFDPESRRRFEVEAKAAAKLAHPNIVTVHELGEDRGILFIAMEMLPGVDLDSLLRSGEALPLAEKLDVVAQVCRGLAFAHDRGVVHRDIKPSNVRLLDDGTAKIMDFGIAKLGACHHITKTGMMVGTVHYMSPEQVRGKPLDGRSDVFSAGVILYELLAGERPFPGEDVTQILYKIVNEEPKAPDLVRRSASWGRSCRRSSRRPWRRTLTRATERRRVRPGPGRARGRNQKAQGQTASAMAEALAAARRALRDGHVEEAVARLRGLVAEQPDCVDARRALRAAQREQKSRQESEVDGLRRLPRAGSDVPGRAHAARGAGRPGDARRPRSHRARADGRGRARPGACGGRHFGSDRARVGDQPAGLAVGGRRPRRRGRARLGCAVARVAAPARLAPPLPQRRRRRERPGAFGSESRARRSRRTPSTRCASAASRPGPRSRSTAARPPA